MLFTGGSPLALTGAVLLGRRVTAAGRAPRLAAVPQAHRDRVGAAA